MPPTTAPSGESRPPRIMAGNATRAMRPTPGLRAGAAGRQGGTGQRGDQAGDAPRHPVDPPGADALGQRRLLVEGGGPHGQAERRSSGRRRRTPPRTTAVKPMVQRSLSATDDVAEGADVEAPRVAEVLRVRAPDRGDDVVEDEQHADRDHHEREGRLADHAPQHERFDQPSRGARRRPSPRAARGRSSAPRCWRRCR